jgi:hypothetical protein
MAILYKFHHRLAFKLRYLHILSDKSKLFSDLLLALSLKSCGSLAMHVSRILRKINGAYLAWQPREIRTQTDFMMQIEMTHQEAFRISKKP